VTKGGGGGERICGLDPFLLLLAFGWHHPHTLSPFTKVLQKNLIYAVKKYGNKRDEWAAPQRRRFVQGEKRNNATSALNKVRRRRRRLKFLQFDQ
jgi:hypothetical protein